MARAQNKQSLLEFSSEDYIALMNLIDNFSYEQKIDSFSFEDRDKNIKDVLIHLYEWHQLLLFWIDNNLKKIESYFFPKLYNWKTYPDLNIEFWKKTSKNNI